MSQLEFIGSRTDSRSSRFRLLSRVRVVAPSRDSSRLKIVITIAIVLAVIAVTAYGFVTWQPKAPVRSWSPVAQIPSRKTLDCGAAI